MSHYGLNVVRVRTFNHEGPRRENVFGISSYAYQIAKIEAGLQKIVKVGYLGDKRNFTHVYDIIKAYWLAVQKCKPGKMYLIGNNDKSIHTFKQALDKLKKLSFCKNIKHQEYKPFVRPTKVPFLITDSKQFSKLTRWKPKISFDQILKDTLNYWRQKIN